MTYGIFILRGNQWRRLRTCDSLSDAKQELDPRDPREDLSLEVK